MSKPYRAVAGTPKRPSARAASLAGHLNVEDDVR